jgi:hypothetical protein
MLSVEQVNGRYGRLEALSVGLAREMTLVQQAADPLLYLALKAYLGALGDALAGVEDARVTLAKALQRIDREGRTLA